MEKSIISEQLIILDLDADNKNTIIEAISQLAFEHGYISDLGQFIETVKQREEQFSTAIGYGIGMPHGKSNTVLSPFISFARLKIPFYWDEEELVKYVFLIGVPEADVVLHLKFISQLSKKLLDDDYRNALADFETTKQVEAHLSQIEI
ncbi:hypothetical protein CBG46_02365 [Actinobacillus succinogenes]|uniref:Putative PTS IIA-like nitrogen-regulatory protein PtsN n=1 Tax=Actinobacillus succinogenes (strain ATCC 55618 / DSM 22257 / CCUG 43843 / 130Z) TaxID=339671 RepID=A6VLW2_ACTSZ|nr:PTS sugar transporter subunit IIA [Actinobacillus succinogenes]ABR73959.1 putative PTS IIA-like nitrogen-regulatory protein PtsN [Actinobacillus succinogenes 130Z]PHI39598.1 hypothetical protein CBG46_02365 [Actinobacillus succinogenes]